ncbi:MAG: NHL repeat-containing protein [Melioribacter sp.]|uniref:NHL repeat-containing protein n=1 Tax=Rosettibacter primus TaxID=3111523 RepID=UPI00247B935E|nr:NHL repeat-containing protein [Melioribacter sp.]
MIELLKNYSEYIHKIIVTISRLISYMSILLFLFLTNQNTQAQSFLFQNEIGSFNSAYAFSINPSGFIYVSDAAENEIIKLDTLGNTLKTFGGYGFDNNSFDLPIDITATTLNVYVADKFNDRIQIFDKDLNYISSLSANSIENDFYKFRYPIGTGISSQGDIFLIDSDNSRILKFTSAGKFLAEIGSRESGDFALQNPRALAIIDNKILVIDNNFLLIYDLFGNNISKFKFQEQLININSTFSGIILCSQKIIYFSLSKNNLQTLEFKNFDPQIEDIITDCLIFNQKLYLLTPKKILIYKIISE